MPDAQIEANVLRALASAPELSTQNIQSSTVYGTVTLTGNVHDEAMRTKAENLVARAAGVKKVVDELALGDTPPPAEQAGAQPMDQAAPDQGPPEAGQPQDNGAYPPPPPQEAQNGAPPQPDQSGQYPPQPPQGAPQANGQYPGGYGPPQSQGAPPTAQQQQQYPGGYGPPQDQSAGQPYGPPQGQDQGQPYGPPPARRPMYANGAPQNYAIPGGQQAGIPVTVPAGALLRIRINRGLDSNHVKPGTQFDGTVLSDVAADGAIAIPRGASVQGVVVDAKKAGALSGRGELGLQINSVTLGGVTYPLSTEVWQRNSRDKTAGTVNSALGLGVIGAVLGGIAGGGAGAAIGAGVGGAAGVGAAAASPNGRVIIPPEAVLNFRMAQPAVVKTVSEQEMSRLAYAAGSAQPPQRPMRRYYSPYYGYYYAPY